jgi:hypothetical protein
MRVASLGLVASVAATLALSPLVVVACRSDQSACRETLAHSDEGFKQGVAAASKACARDDECTTVTSSCRPGCDHDVIAKGALSAYSHQTAPLAGDCGDFEKRDCVRVLALGVPSCSPAIPVCVDGQCTAKR